jgi:hypothetical protein
VTALYEEPETGGEEELAMIAFQELFGSIDTTGGWGGDVDAAVGTAPE